MVIKRHCIDIEAEDIESAQNMGVTVEVFLSNEDEIGERKAIKESQLNELI